MADPDSSSSNVALQVRDLSLAYGAHTVVHAASFSLRAGSIGCLLGPSGCGKTTLLRAIAGFEPVQAGEIRFGERCVAAPDLRVAPEARHVGMVFQDFALFPHLSVADNIGFGLRRLGRAARAARVRELLALVGLASLGERYPHELSGGQQQRVALARALAPRPALVLLDEPFSSLDVDLRERLSVEVREILKQSGTTAILVTHDQHEAFAMADEIGVMEHGHIRQWDTAYRLYHEPASRFVADFVGEGAFLPGRILEDGQVAFELGRLRARQPIQCCRVDGGCAVDILLRPDDVAHEDSSPLQAEVVSKAFRGAEFLYTLRLDSGSQLLSMVPSHHNHAIGERIGIRLEVDHVVTFPNDDPPPAGELVAGSAGVSIPDTDSV